jgi:hypothetical protein
MLTLVLSKLPSNTYGIYGPNKDIMAERMLYLHPDAAKSFMTDLYPKRVCVSDMFRSADASLQARGEKKGVQPPSKSGHNFGFSIDVDLDRTLKLLSMTKPTFDDWMNGLGWFCHRKDHLQNESEAWHYNYFGISIEKIKYLSACEMFHSTAEGLEAKIQDYYGSEFMMDPPYIQTCLKQLKIYGGEIDGQLGPLTVRAIKAFQTSWELTADGIAGRDTMRLLAYLNSQTSLVALAGPPALV